MSLIDVDRGGNVKNLFVLFTRMSLRHNGGRLCASHDGKRLGIIPGDHLRAESVALYLGIASELTYAPTKLSGEIPRF